MKLSCHRDKSRNFWKKIFPEKKICKSTPNGSKREKNDRRFCRLVGRRAGPSGGPNLTIFPGRACQIKVPYKVSLNSIQKYGLDSQRRICCNQLPFSPPPLYDFLCDFLSCILLAASPLAARRYRFHEFMACSILLTLIGQIL